ncbi:response regulator [Candidatus Peregrinibacteria bacterium]|nr:response regulator [Candidatus Peregrinibacteria bacterium]
MPFNNESSINTKETATQTHTNLLIIEDDKTVVTYARRVLQPGYQHIQVVGDGNQAIEIIMAARDRIDVLSDYHLLGRTTGLGVAIATAEKRRNLSGQFVITSGTSDTELIRQIENHLRADIINGFLEKPYSIKALREIFFKK